MGKAVIFEKTQLLRLLSGIAPDIGIKNVQTAAEGLVPCQLVKGAKKCKQAYLWCRLTGVGPPMIAYHFSPSRSRDVAESLLGDYSGTIIRDSYTAYEKLDCEVACCWAHVRRRFLQTVECGYTKAELPLKMIQALYKIERGAKERAEKRARIRLSFKSGKMHAGSLRSWSRNFLRSAGFSRSRSVHLHRSRKPSLMP